MLPTAPRAIPAAAPGAGSAWGLRITIVVTVVWGLGWLMGFVWALGVLTAGAFAAAIAGRRHPVVGLLGVSLLCTMDAPMRHYLLTTGGLLRWNTLNYWLLIVVLTSVPLIERMNDVQSRLLKLFLVVMAAGLVFTPSLELGIQHMLGIASIFGLLVYFTLAGADRDSWFWMGIANGVLAALGGLLFYVTRERIPDININAWGFFPLTAIFAICLAYRFAPGRRFGVAALAGLAMINVLWVFLSGSRGNLLIAIACLLFLLAITPGVSRRIGIVVAASLMLLLAASWFSDLQQHALHRIGKLLDSDRSAMSRTSGRSELAIGGWIMFSRHPLGVGTGGFSENWAELGYADGLSGFRVGEEFQAHSGWVKVLAENGLPGALLFGAYVASFALVGFRRREPGQRSLGLMATATLAVAFISTEFQGKGFWFFAAGASTQLNPREALAAVRESMGISGPFRHRLTAPLRRRVEHHAGSCSPRILRAPRRLGAGRAS
jgi:hypothetical protein